ncbi:hypothetical protein [Asticcacaulis sp. MM231]|uniref:hypothetical protein n=1 Tax=Asticcacaulis sp. MM231 TaxID=3157666 RepID=UPI0032D5AD3D
MAGKAYGRTFFWLVFFLAILMVGPTAYFAFKERVDFAGWLEVGKCALGAIVIGALSALLLTRGHPKLMYLGTFFAIGFYGGYLDNAHVSLSAVPMALIVASIAHRYMAKHPIPSMKKVL